MKKYIYLSHLGTCVLKAPITDWKSPLFFKCSNSSGAPHNQIHYFSISGPSPGENHFVTLLYLPPLLYPNFSDRFTTFTSSFPRSVCSFARSVLRAFPLCATRFAIDVLNRFLMVLGLSRGLFAVLELVSPFLKVWTDLDCDGGIVSLPACC